jgi:hypothetical protein
MDVDVDHDDVGDHGSHQFEGGTNDFVHGLDDGCRGQGSRRARSKVRVGKDEEALTTVSSRDRLARGS